MWSARIWVFALLLSLLVCGVIAQEDLYKVLGLKKSASDSDIKKAYRKLSRKYHPDKNQDEGANEKFIAVSNAYEALSDPDSRSVYDRYGHDGLKQHEAQKSGGGGHHNPFDVFSQFFGRQQQQERRGPGLLTNLEVTLADMYRGKTAEFVIPRKILCDHCRGSGAASDGDIRQCGTCGGRGAVIQQAQVFPGMYTNVQSTCPTCSGKGKVIHRACAHCKGDKTVQTQATLTVDIPPGAPEGWEYVFEGEADESPDWEAGDVFVRVRSNAERAQADGWRRKDGGLYRREVIGVDEALLGFERNVTHLDGRTVPIRRPGTTQPNHVDVFRGEGMPPHAHFPQGDMFVEYAVVLPSEVSAKARQALTDVFAGYRQAARSRDEL